MISFKSAMSVLDGEFVAFVIAGWTNMKVRQVIPLLSPFCFLAASARLSRALASFCRAFRFRSRAIDSGKAMSAMQAADDALTLHWKDAWYAALRLEGGTPMDLRPYVAGGTLEFDLDVMDMARAGLSFSMFPDNDLTSLLYFSVMPFTTSRDSLFRAIEIESDPWITATSWLLPFPPSIFANLTGTLVTCPSTL